MNDQYQETYYFCNSPIAWGILLVGISVVVLGWFGILAPREFWRLPYLTILVVLSLAMLVKCGLFVDRNGVCSTFSIFDFHTTPIPLADIVSVEITHFRTDVRWLFPVLWYSRYGNDNKRTGYKFMKQGVVIKTKDGKEHVFESSDPQKFKDAISRLQEKHN